MKKYLIASLLLLLLASSVYGVFSGASSAARIICILLSRLVALLMAIAAGVGVVVITLQGIKWAGSAEDPGARKAAKQGIIHAIIGLIIVLLAIIIVTIIFAGKFGCDATLNIVNFGTL